MLEHLFGSKTRANLLRVFFRDPDKPYFVRELTRLLDVQINAIRRELDILKKLELIHETDAPEEKEKGKKAGSSRRKYYKIDPKALLYKELKQLLIRAQLVDEQVLVREIMNKGGKIKLFMVTGRFTGDKRAPVDMLIVGTLKEASIAKIVAKYEKKFGFDINYTTMPTNEFSERRHMMDKFLYSIFEADHLSVVDDLES